MRILSGIQASGSLHLGNYFGMIERAVAQQNEGAQCVYFIADYHALTSVQNADDLREHSKHIAMALLACGVDPQKTVLFRQSAVPEVHELAWFLSTVTPMGLLERCHSYKDKIAKGIPPSHGLFAYPVLMAADILLYDSDSVPVGQDQKQHLEVTRDLAEKFNDRWGKVFKIPEPDIIEESAVVPGVDGQKMSKSYANTIELFSNEKKTQKRVMSIQTDSTPIEEPKKVEGSTLAALYRLVDREGYPAFAENMEKGGVGYGDLKKTLATAVNQFFSDYRERYAELEKKPQELEEILEDGAHRARELAQKTLNRVRKKIGMDERSLS